ncbi:MAG: STAS domain-containing protein [Gemmataceae bacterium]
MRSETTIAAAVRIDAREFGAALILRVSGAATDGLADDFRRELARIPAPNAIVVLDMEEMTEISSLVLGALMEFRHRLRRRRRELRVANVRAEVWSAFVAVRLDEMFPKFDSVEEAAR